MNDLPSIVICARRPASLRPSEVAQGYFAEFVEARKAEEKAKANRIMNECCVLAPLATDMPNDRRDLRDRTVLCVSGPKRMASASAGAYGANTEHSDFLANAERKANSRRFLPQAATPTHFGGL